MNDMQLYNMTRTGFPYSGLAYSMHCRAHRIASRRMVGNTSASYPVSVRQTSRVGTCEARITSCVIVLKAACRDQQTLL